MKKSVVVIFVLLVFFFSACKKASNITYDCSAINPTYTNDVKAIVDANCATAGCHNAATKASGIDLSTYSLVKSQSGQRRFLGSIEHASGYKSMPEGASKLSDVTIQTIACWIEQGAVEN